MFHRAISWLSFACAVAGFLLVFTPHARAQDGCALTKLATLDMLPGDPQRILVKATLAGHEKDLILDTGAAGSMLTESTVKELGLSPQMVSTLLDFRMASKTQIHESAVVPSVQLGELHGTNYAFGILPDSEIEESAAGLLGGDMIRRFDVELDFAAAKVDIYSSDHCPGKVVHWTRAPYAAIPFHFDDGNHIVIPVTLDGVPLVACVDTGAPNSVMPLETARTVFGWRSDPAGLTPLSKDGSVKTYPFGRLSLGGASVGHPTVGLRDDLTLGHVDMLVGFSALKAFHIYISYKDQLIFLTARDAH